MRKQEDIFEGSSRGLDRILAFSDSIISIAISLSVVGVLPPTLNSDLARHGVGYVLRHEAPGFFYMALTFWVVGAYWMAHHRIFSLIRTYDPRLMQLNLVFLMLIVLMPFATHVVSAGGSDRDSAILYAAYMAGTGLVLHLLWRYASQSRRLVDRGLSDRTIRYFKVRTLIAPLVFLLSIGVCLISPVWGRYSWCLLFFHQRLTDRLFKQG